MWIRALRSVLRAPEGDAPAGGGSSAGGDDVSALKARLAVLEREAADAKKAAADAETGKAKANGEIDKVIKRYEDDLKARDAQIAELSQKHDGLTRSIRQAETAKAVAAKLGVDVSPILIGLLPQTGEDIAPEKLTEGHIGRIAEAVRKLAPELKPSGRASAVPGTGPTGSESPEEYWKARGRAASGQK